MTITKLTVGIVEDEALVREYLKRAFESSFAERSNFEFLVLATSSDEVAKNWAIEDSVDVWIIDLKLPPSGNSLAVDWKVGRDLIRHLHEQSTGAIIVYTSEVLGASASELLTLGADDFVRKGEVEDGFNESTENMQAYLRAKIISVWRRAKLSRPNHRAAAIHARHSRVASSALPDYY